MFLDVKHALSRHRWLLLLDPASIRCCSSCQPHSLSCCTPSMHLVQPDHCRACVNDRLERRGGTRRRRRRQTRALCCARSRSGCPGSPRPDRWPLRSPPWDLHAQSAVVMRHASAIFQLHCLQAKSKSRQANYFSLLAKSRSGPARDISVDFGSSTGLMSRQASESRAVGTDINFHRGRQQSMCVSPPGSTADWEWC